MNKKIKKNILFCDFETNSKDSEKMVYAWMCKDSLDFRPYKAEGTSIQSFLNNLWKLPFKTKRVLKMLFHNGSTFDFHFIVAALAKDSRFRQRDFIDSKKLIEYLRESNYKKKNTVLKREKLQDGDYEILADGTSRIYQIVIHLEIDGKMKVIYLTCAYLTFSYPLAKLGNVLGKCGYDMKKGDIEHKDRYYNNIEELKADSKVYEYLERDVDILRNFWLEYTKQVPYQHQEMTAAATAWWDWLLRSQKDLEEIHKSIYGEQFYFVFEKQKKGGQLKKYIWFEDKKIISPKHHLKKLVEQLFPMIGTADNDYIRNWYNGGLTTLNWSKMGKIQEKVNYFDINSAYPNAMMNSRFPLGKPIKGAKKGYDFQLVELKLLSDCSIKKENLPFVFTKSLKGSKFYLKRLPKGQVIYLTGEEFKIFKNNYVGFFKAEVKFSFKTIEGKKLFGAYITHWYNIKKKKENPILVLVAKLMLNSLYGKFGSKNRKESKILNPDKVKNWNKEQLSMTKWEIETGLFEASYYLPIGIKITADVRLKLVQTVGNNYSKFLYCDTDSIAFSDDHRIPIGEELGEWKIEAENVKMLVGGKKRYILENKEIKKIAFASYKLAAIQDKVSFDSFIYGMNGIRHLHKKEVQNGVVLHEGSKDIKEIWSSSYERSPDCWFSNKEEYFKGNK